jgi:hypothetical protein
MASAKLLIVTCWTALSNKAVKDQEIAICKLQFQ